MSKRSFRSSRAAAPPDPEYPTLQRFDEGRRSFLRQLGGAVLGLGVLGAGLAACDGRPVKTEPDADLPPGVPRAPDAGIDGTIGPDGSAPVPDAKIDHGAIAGGAPAPDAEVDKTDLDLPDGLPPAPDMGR